MGVSPMDILVFWEQWDTVNLKLLDDIFRLMVQFELLFLMVG